MQAAQAPSLNFQSYPRCRAGRLPRSLAQGASSLSSESVLSCPETPVLPRTLRRHLQKPGPAAHERSSAAAELSPKRRPRGCAVCSVLMPPPRCVCCASVLRDAQNPGSAHVEAASPFGQVPLFKYTLFRGTCSPMRYWPIRDTPWSKATAAVWQATQP